VSTKKQTTTTASYDPTAQNVYNQLNPAATAAAQQNMTNPWQAMQGNLLQGQMNNQVFGQTQVNNQALVQSLIQRGINPNSPMFTAMLNQAQRASGQARTAGTSNLLLQAQNLATGTAQAATMYQPLQTGGTSTEQTSGLGTWLPQLGAAAISTGEKLAAA
jgi:hypothetical protein